MPASLRALGGVQLLILDDWGLEPLDAQARHDLLEILEERYGRRSTIITSQLPVDSWHDVIGDPTYADAILDRLVHNAHRIDLTGDSLRRKPPHKTVAKIDPALTRCHKFNRQRGSAHRATSCRNPGRHQIGMPGRLHRNQQLARPESGDSVPSWRGGL